MSRSKKIPIELRPEISEDENGWRIVGYRVNKDASTSFYDYFGFIDSAGKIILCELYKKWEYQILAVVEDLLDPIIYIRK